MTPRIMANQAYGRRLKEYRLVLECGHPVLAHNQPWPDQKFGCTVGLGCGYQLRWVSYTNKDGRLSENRKHFT